MVQKRYLLIFNPTALRQSSAFKNKYSTEQNNIMKLQPKKSLGQHFLNSKHVLDQIISAGEIKSGESVLEIGPGTGILTTALLEAGAKVIAVEKDRLACELLKSKFSRQIADKQLELIEGDILDEKTFNSYALIANIPYYITGAILEKFLEYEPRPNRMVLLVQKEVADRIVALNGKESVLSISVKAFGTPKIIAKVPPGAFTPPPTVDSAILSIKNINDNHFVNKLTGKKADVSEFFKIVKAGFAHKRKYLIRNLESVIAPEKLSQIWQENKFDPKIRAEDLKLEQWFCF